MKGGITVTLGCVLLVLASLLGPALFLKRWTDDVWKERALAVTNLFRANQSEIIVKTTMWQRISVTRKMLNCSPSTVCSASSWLPLVKKSSYKDEAAFCPFYFKWIRQDMKPWAKSGITIDMVEAAKPEASFRLTVVNGRMYIESYRKCYQSRDLFTIWGIAQLLKFYPRLLPDLDLMFNCDDNPVIHRGDYNDSTKPPPPLFRYSGSEDTFDIVFPDWSFWGWPEIRTPPWETLAKEIQNGSQKVKWEDRDPTAYWKGNPYMGQGRQDLMNCIHRRHWGGRLYNQDWDKETRQGFRQSKLSDQCHHRYKIYIEGNAWSVSLKNIMACDSPTLLITPQYYDFYLRGLVPQRHYWPIRADKKCDSIQFAVDWGNKHPKEAMEIAKEAIKFIQNELKMSNVYDYMFHILNEYSKLLKYKPSVSEKAAEYCSETIFCFANEAEEDYMKDSVVTTASASPPCKLGDLEWEEKAIKEFLVKKANSIDYVKHLEDIGSV
jgi:hypothetical protein